MNHTYRVVYNESTNTYVAVAEFEPSKGKSKSSKKAVAVAVALAAAQLVPLTAQAAVSIGSASGTSINRDSTATAEGNGVAVGSGASVTGIGNAVAVGSGASATGTDVAVGPNATATGADNIAIGNNSKASSADSTLNYGIIAIGNQSNGSASEVVAIGQLACATASQAVALGSQTKATGDQSVAIGGNAVSSGASALALGGDDLNKASGASLSTNGKANTDDAGLNKGAVNAKFKEISGQDLVKKDDNLSSTTTEAQYMPTNAYGAASIAVGIQSRSGDLATAFGTQSFATGLASTALGVASNASGNGSIAIGPGTDATGEQSIGMGANASSSNNHSIAIGTNATASGNQSISIGYANNVSGNNSGAFGDLSTITGSGAYTVGNNNTMAANEAGAFGNLNNFTSAANYSRAVGNRNNVSGSNTMVLGNNITAATNGSVVLGNSSSGSMSVDTCSSATVNDITYGNFAGKVTDTGKYVSVGASADDARKIVNVAAGNISATSTEAINGSQLYLIANQITTTAQLSNQENGTVSAKNVDNTPNLVNATTVADAINKSGWKTKNSDGSVSVINPGDAVNYENGAGTTVNVSTNAATGVTTVKYNVNTATFNNTATTPQANAVTINAAGQAVAPNTQAAKDSFITAVDTVNLVNNISHNIMIGRDDEAFADQVGKAPNKVKAGDTITLNAGKNLIAKQNGNNITFATANDVTFNNVNTTTMTVGSPTDTNGDGKPDNAVNFKAEAATPASNNPMTNAPTTALNITSADGKPTQITGVASSLNTTTVAINPDSNATTKEQPATLVDLANASNVNAAATVGDLQNMGWVVSTKDSNGYTDVVKNANQVDFKGTGLATVKGETVNGVRTITVDVNAQSTVENAQLPIVYTNENGDKLVKGQDGKFYKPADIAKATYNPTTKKYTNTAGKTVAPATTVIASMNNGDNSTTAAPMALDNVKGNLVQTLNAGDLVENANGTLTVGSTPTAANAYTKSASAPTTNQVAAMYNKAATVGDVLNAGWNLQGNGQAVDFVKPYDTVNFVNGAGTTATVTSGGNVSNVSYNVAVDNKTTQIVDEKGNPLVQAANGNYYPAGTQMDSTGNPVDTATPAVQPAGTQVAAKTTDLTVNNGKVDTPTNGSSLVNATTVANAINNSGFTLTAQGKNGSVVNPGETVDMKNTDGNIVISKDATNNDVVYNLAKNITVDSVTAGNTKLNTTGVTITGSAADPTKTVSLTNGGLNNGGNKITNVAAGEADTDAVNVSQLKSQVAASKETVVSKNQTVRIKEGTNATGGKEFDLSVNTGNSLTISSSGVIDVKTDDKTIKQGSTGALEVVTTNLTVANNGKVDTPTNGSSLVNAT
ncbi:ESPR-type extended signal peptide-containing protein, partial [Kingella kingae]